VTPRSAEGADFAIPAGAGVAAVLHEARAHHGVIPQRLELIEGDVADPEESGFPGGVNLFHRTPHLEVSAIEAVAARGSVEQVRVDRVHLEMLEGAGERLVHLCCWIGGGIVRKAVILPICRGELRLQEELIAGHQPVVGRLRHGGADAGLEVVPTLVRRVDSAEAGLQRQARETLGLLLFPGGAVKEGRYGGCHAAIRPSSRWCPAAATSPDSWRTV
jgi:hypothetical protein